MNVPVLLLIVLLVLMVAVGGERGKKSFFTLCINFIMLFVLLIFISNKMDPIKVTVYGCIAISSVTLFYINGVNRKTVSSLVSVILVVMVTILITYRIGTGAKIQGFGNEQYEGISHMSLYVQVNFNKIVICEILLGLLGAIIDVSVSISSAMNELYRNDRSIDRKSLLVSGINIGKDILGTMTNTLLFAYIGGFMALMVWFSVLEYSIPDILNAKVFCSEMFQVLCSGIGIVLIIPVTAVITSSIMYMERPYKTRG